ncbi:MAG: UDP-glucose/GDP-mannose dehydrogenase family protein [Candidatus Diapherotrites archaeon]|nr:UDP-glucose/GDP-mannose dehydrogenase family protein [Candidatus Diapherotrites archaeon]
MKVAVVGTGYVGLITGTAFALKGHGVTCVDTDEAKVKALNNKSPHIYEEGLAEALEKTVGKTLGATTSLADAVSGAGVVFIAVGTPSRADGSINDDYVMQAAKGIRDAIPNSEKPVVVVKSTVLPGTGDRVAVLLGEKSFVASNPEFLQEGKALHGALHPDRIVVGTEDEEAKATLGELYSSFDAPVFHTSRSIAEMVKYASNAFLATKISFINEIGNLCKALGIDTREVARGIGMDHRINHRFLGSGCGFGGSCFPKDVKAIVARAREEGVGTPVLDGVLRTNDEQVLRLIKLAKKHTPLKGRRVGVFGLAFKPGTDDVRESPALRLIPALLNEGAVVSAYDPKAMDNAGGLGIGLAASARELADSSEVCFIVTDWDEFKDDSLYTDKIVVDGRGVTTAGCYEGVCW